MTQSTPQHSEPTKNNNLNSRSGQSMDRKIVSNKFKFAKPLVATAVVISLSVFGYSYVSEDAGKTLNVSNQQLYVSAVKQGVFEDFIPVRTRVVPLKTVYLDAIEGGRVEKVLIEDGTIVNQGQPIVQLSNTQLQLDVMRNEAAVTEQLNNMRNIELSLEQNRLAHKRNIIELNYQIKTLSKQLVREQSIQAYSDIAASEVESTQDQLEYNKQRLELTLESQKTDALMQEQQLTFLKDSGSRLEQSLTFAKRNMDNLNMRAPVAGKLSGFDIEIGQSVSRGERIGQIDDPNSFKLEANIDEYYLNEIALGQTASIDHNQSEYGVTVKKIYPDVKNGQFKVDFKFIQQPEGIRRGQTLQAKLSLGDDKNVLLIPNGAFYQDTGGNWIYVVSADGSVATKRNIKTGKKNSRYIEVVSGLYANEQVITSPYSSFKNVDQLKLK